MRDHLIEELLDHLDEDGSLRVGDCEQRLADMIEELPLPLSLKRLLQWHWLQAPDARIGPYAMRSVGQILAPDDLRRLLPAQMLAVGSAANGDLLALAFSDERCEVGVTGHDQLLDDDEVDPRTCYAKIADSLEEFLLRASEGMYIPSDFYAAREYAELRSEMSRFRSDG